MFSQVNSCFKEFTVFEMVKRLHTSLNLSPQLVGEPRELYFAIEQTIEAGEVLGAAEVFDKLHNPNFKYNSVQKKIQKLNKEFDKILKPYTDHYNQTPQLTNFIRSELIRFACYLSKTVKFDDPNNIQTQISLYSDVDVVSLRAKNQALEHETAVLNEDLQLLQAQLHEAREEKSYALKMLDLQQGQLDILSDRSASNATLKNNEAILNELFSIHDVVKSQNETLHLISQASSSYSVDQKCLIAKLEHRLNTRFTAIDVKLGRTTDHSGLQNSIDNVSEQISRLPDTQLITQSFATVDQQFECAKINASCPEEHAQNLVKLQSHVEERLRDIKSAILASSEGPSIHLIVDEVKDQVERLVRVNNSAQAFSEIDAQLNTITDDKLNVLKSVETLQAQIESLSQTTQTDAYLTMNQKVASELSCIHQLAKSQSQSISTLTHETTEHTEKHEMLFINIQEQLNGRLNAMETSIIASTSQTKLLLAIEDIDAHVADLINVSKESGLLPDIQQSQNRLIEQLADLSNDINNLQNMSSASVNLTSSSIDNGNDVLIAIDEKISRLGSHHGDEVDVERLNKAFEYICELVKDVIAQNQNFEERSIVPVENISHLVKSNEALSNKLDKVSEEKRDAVKQLSNMIKATSNSTLHKTSFTNTAAVTELKSKLSKAEAKLMKNREDQSLLRRQLEAKDKKIERLSLTMAV
jgi:hypothetical protein